MHTKMQAHGLAAGLVAVAAMTGCGSLADSDYQGESLMRIEGSIVSAAGSLPAMDVALLWQILPDDKGCTRAADGVARATTAGTFPAAFRLEVTQPPPAAAFAPDSPVAEAYVAAMDRDSRVYGYAADSGKVVYKVFYSKRDLPAGSPDSARFGGTGLRAGYQLGIWDLSGSAAAVRIAGEREVVSIEITSPGGTPVPESICPTGPQSPGGSSSPTPPAPGNN